jgi:hypothetical protein
MPPRMGQLLGSWQPHRSRLCATGNGSATPAWDNAELAPETQVVADRSVLDDLAVLEPDDVDLAGGDGLVGRGQPDELAGVPCVQRAVDDDGVALGDEPVDLEARLREPPFSHRMAWIMPSGPGGAPGGGSWLTQSGWISALKPSTSPLGRISSKVRRAMALRSSAMTGSLLAVSESRRSCSAKRRLRASLG